MSRNMSAQVANLDEEVNVINELKRNNDYLKHLKNVSFHVIKIFFRQVYRFHHSRLVLSCQYYRTSVNTRTKY